MDNREAILECALVAFATRGYDAVGIQELVAAAGITKPTLYHYFGSKQGLLESLLQVYFERLFASLKGAADYQGDLSLNIHRIVSAYFQFAREYPLFYRLQLSMVFAPEDSVPARVLFLLNQKQHLFLEQLFVAASGDHGSLACRQQFLAATLLSVINTCIGLWFLKAFTLDEEGVFKAVRSFLHGIFV